MKKNIGYNDKVIRLTIAIILMIFYYKAIFPETLGIVALILAFVLTITSLIGFCPLYTLFGISSCNKKKK